MLCNRRMTRHAIGFTLVTITAIAGALGDYDLSWYTIDGGGETFSTGGDFEHGGTIGQPDANTTVMTGGNFELAGGFWPGTTPFCHGDINGDGEVGLNDLAELLGHYGETGASYEDGDLTGDGATQPRLLGA